MLYLAPEVHEQKFLFTIFVTFILKNRIIVPNFFDDKIKTQNLLILL
jgi:hypothetical protein